MNAALLKRLEDAKAACLRILSFVEGQDRTAFLDNALLRSAVERQLEIVGEALGKALAEDTTLAARIPDIHKMIGMRNRIIHGYDSVDDELVWDVIQTHIPALLGILGELRNQS